MVIPTSLDPSERIHTFDMIDLIDDVLSEYNEHLKAYVVFNRIKATLERNYMDDFKEGFPAYLHWLDGFIMQRIKFSRVYGQGKTVFDLVDKEVDKKPMKKSCIS